MGDFRVSRDTLKILKMQNPIQTYAWGSRKAIADLLGQHVPSPEPQAELWMGAHPKSPSKVRLDGRWQSLLTLIDRFPQELLGQKVSEHYNRTLPYLFKVLAAGEPLSIQAHPDAEQAIEGFNRENLQGLALEDPQRNYRDDRPKPECMCALTPFTGLCGFRSPQEVAAVSEPVWPKKYDTVSDLLGNANRSDALRTFFQSLMQSDAARIAEITTHVVEKSEVLRNQNEIYDWVIRLHQKYPGDVGVLSPLILNVIQLKPGEALFLPPKQLHAYLDGLGIELMANSDNVLRGGLTPKHIDVQELMKILSFEPYKPDVLTPYFKHETEGVYASSTDTFSLSQLIVTGRQPHKSDGRRQGPEIILGVEGSAAISQDGEQEPVSIEKGESVFVPAAVNTYTVTGNAKLFKAAVHR